MRPIIQSQKRIVQVTLSNVIAGSTASVTIANAVQGAQTTAPNDVPVGSIIKAVYCEMWLLGDGQQPNTSTAMIVKVPADSGGPDASDFTNLNGWANKNNILKMHQGLVGDANANPIPFFREWIPIPKGKQRMAIGDQIQYNVKAITEGLQFCGHFIFKVYT